MKTQIQPSTLHLYIFKDEHHNINSTSFKGTVKENLARKRKSSLTMFLKLFIKNVFITTSGTVMGW